MAKAPMPGDLYGSRHQDVEKQFWPYRWVGQLWVPGRHGQISDVGADLAGASIGVMVALAAMRLRSFVLPG